MGNNKITPSKSQIYNKLLNVASKYTELDTDYLTSGLFGYVTESIAMLMRDSSIHKNMLYNESFLNTAVMPKSIYNWAKMFSIEVSKASPAYADIEIRIPRSQIPTAGNLILNYRDPIVAGDYYFSIERSILVASDHARYLGSDSDDSINYPEYMKDQEYSTKFLNNNLSYLPFSYEDENVVIKARAYQYKITKITKKIVSTSFLNKVHIFEFQDQFAGATMEYRENGHSEKIALKYSNLSTVSSESKVAYYNITDSNTLEIIFRNNETGFLPSANSEIILNIFTTSGKNVPDKFTGDASIRVSSESLRSIPIKVTFNPSEIIGGKDAPSLDRIKKTIINEISTRNTIVTENDLNQYFEILTSTISEINDSRITFVKKRDDILRRVFTAYILLRNTSDDMSSETSLFRSYIPKVLRTNTIDAIFDKTKFSSNNAVFNFPSFTKTTNVIDGKIVCSVTERNPEYICPFIMYLTLSPIRKIKYIYTLVDNSSQLITSGKISDTTSDNSRYFIPESVRVIKNLSDGLNTEKGYKIRFTFQTNSTDKIDINNLKLNDNSVSGATIIEEKYENISNGLYYLYLTVLVDYEKDGFNTDGANNRNSNGYLNKIMTIGGVPCGQNNSISLEIGNYTYRSENDLVFFLDLEDIMNSDLSIATSANDLSTIESVTIHSIPVIAAEDVNDLSLNNSIMNQLFTFIKILKENADRLETSTFFDLKFYNTYGESFLYNTYNTNIKLELNIELSPAYKNDLALKKRICSYIRQAVDLSNDVETIKISRLITSITQNFNEYIDGITFLGLDDTFNQNIIRTDADPRIYVPEWINLDSYNLDECIIFS